MKKIQNKSTIVLAISLAVVLLFSIVAMALNTSGFSVKVSRVYFDTERGTLSGLLYMPKGVSAANPAPALVTTHGYLNSAEMQDANAIEMSRRGFVVLAMDMYDHGHSKGNADNTGAFFSFWPRSQFDAVSYIYGQDYVLKDEEGNGMIGVTGHSMGGFSSAMAVFFDETEVFPETGHRMIHAVLTEGADYQWSAYMGLDTAMADATAGGRYYGKVAAQYDEFFFNNSEVKAPGTVVKKDYVNTPDGLIFLQQTEAGTAEAYKWYETSDGGHRIVYEPAETHPWNHFSMKTTGTLLDFYATAFEGQPNIKNISSSNQIWLAKEYAECVALIGFLVFIMALAAVLLKAPFIKNAKSGEALTTKPASTVAEKIASVSLFVATMLIPAVIFPVLYDGSYTAEGMAWLKYAGVIAIVLAVVGIIISAMNKADKDSKTHLIGSIVVLVAGIGLVIMTTSNAVTSSFFGNGKLFKAGVPTSIMKWALVCAFISAIISTVVYVFSKKDKGVVLAHYGITGNGSAICASLVLAIVLTVAAYAVLFLVDALFKTDFRYWTFAFKTFEGSALAASFIYMPFFFIYYFVASAGAVANTSSEKLQGVKGYIVAALTNCGGITVWLLLQYGLLFAKGVAFYPGQALSGILLIALVPALAVASCFSKYLYKKTGNIWTGAFLNAILMTIMTIANTTVYYQM